MNRPIACIMFLLSLTAVAITPKNLDSYTRVYEWGKEGDNLWLVENAAMQRGIINQNGEKIVEDKYWNISAFPSAAYCKVLGIKENFLVRSMDDKTGIISPTGKTIIACDLDNIYYLGDFTNTFIAKRGVKSGLFNVNGDLLLPIDYTDFTPIKQLDKKILVNHGPHAGVCGPDGRFAIPTDRYHSVELRSSGKHKYFEVKKGNRVGICDTTGRELFFAKGHAAEFDRRKNQYKVYGDGIVSLYSTDGSFIETNPLSSPHKTPISIKAGYFFIVADSTDYVGLNLEDKPVFPPIYEKFNSLGYESRYFLLQKGGYKGLGDIEGNVIIKPDRYYKLDELKSGAETIAFVGKSDERCDIFSTEGKLLCSLDRDMAITPLTNRLIEIKGGVYTSCIDIEGNEVLPFGKYISLKFYDSNYSKDGVATLRANDMETDYVFDLQGNYLRGGLKESMRSAKKLIDNISNYDELFTKGNESFDAKRYREAGQYYSRALAIYETGEAYYNLGLTQFNRGKYAQARSSFRRCSKTSKDKSTKARARNMLSRIDEIEQSLEREQYAPTLNFVNGMLFNTFMMFNPAGYSFVAPASLGFSGTTTTMDDNRPLYESNPSSGTKSSTDICISCGGTGHCDQCGGSGHRTDRMFGTGKDTGHSCGICGGGGKCPKCGGSGRIPR